MLLLTIAGGGGGGGGGGRLGRGGSITGYIAHLVGTGFGYTLAVIILSAIVIALWIAVLYVLRQLDHHLLAPTKHQAKHSTRTVTK